VTIEGHGSEKYVTGRMLDSSVGRNWSHMLAERWTHRAGELSSIVPRDTEIAVLLRGQTLVERRGAGMYQRTLGTRGTIWLCPSGVHEEYVNVVEKIEDCLHIYLPGRPFEDTLLKDLDIDPSVMALRYECIAHDPFVEQIAGQILLELNAQTSSGRLLVEALSGALSAHLVHGYSATNVRLKTSASHESLDRTRLSRVIEFVDAHIDGELSVAHMARAACLSPAHFARSFKATTGQTPTSS
jgi:AraC family transcriptional regulator